MSIKGRLAKGPHGFTSRDYNIDVPCERMTCPANNTLKKTCIMPSAIRIGADGKCKTGQDLVDAQTKRVLKPDGD